MSAEVVYEVPVPGTDVVATLAALPGRMWEYDLRCNGECGSPHRWSASGSVNLAGVDVTPEQVARIAYLLEVEYA